MIELKNVSKIYSLGEQEVAALRDVSLKIEKGELTCVVGPSGAGKSTLLHLIGCLDTPTHGEILFDGKSVSSLPDEELSVLRRDRIGFVFQFFNLLPTLTAEENIALPRLIAGSRIEEVREQVERLLDLVGMKGRRHHRPDQLSGGELQRIAIARALVNDPLVVLADEPTGNLDTANGEVVISLLKQISERGTSSVVVATHNAGLTNLGDRTITLLDGRLESSAPAGSRLDPDAARRGQVSHLTKGGS
jgi:putative ABC transport system ATP-binding protein